MASSTWQQYVVSTLRWGCSTWQRVIWQRVGRPYVMYDVLFYVHVQPILLSRRRWPTSWYAKYYANVLFPFLQSRRRWPTKYNPHVLGTSLPSRRQWPTKYYANVLVTFLPSRRQSLASRGHPRSERQLPAPGLPTRPNPCPAPAMCRHIRPAPI